VKSIRKDIKNVKKGVKYILQKKDIINNILSKIMPDNSNIGPILIDNFCPILAIDCFFQFWANIEEPIFAQYWLYIVFPILGQYWEADYYPNIAPILAC